MLEARAASQAIQHTLREGDDEQLACKKAARNEAFMQSSMDAIHTFGGYGYLRECEVEGDMRDAIGGTLYSSTSDSQHNMIASQ